MSETTTYYDYRFRFTDLVRALQAIQALRNGGLLPPQGLPTNMLGDPRNASGDYEPDPALVAFCGRKGSAEMHFRTEDGDDDVVPARGDPAYWYVAIRSDIPPQRLNLNPADFGLEVTDPAESAAVLGVWA